MTLTLAFLCLWSPSPVAASSVSLAWDASTDPSAAGYNVYFGSASRSYTNVVDAGNGTSVTVSTLVPGATYYFAATTYNASGLESDYSIEVSYTVPPLDMNHPPTLAIIPSLTINQDSGPHTVFLSGISSGADNEFQNLAIDAFSSNEGLVTKPQVNYTSPNTTGSLVITPRAGSYGGPATITVMVDDGGAVSNTFIRTFLVTVLPVNDPPTLDFVPNLTIDQDAGQQSVILTGISAGNPHEAQTLAVAATSSNPVLIPNPAVSYTSPNPTGTLTFTPTANAFGSARIVVVVNDGAATNSVVSRAFVVNVNQTDPGATNLVQEAFWTLWWQHTNGWVAYWQMEGTNLMANARLDVPAADAGWNVVGTGDFGGQTGTDILWQHKNGKVAVWQMDGTNCTDRCAIIGPAVDKGWKVAATGDFNDDGKTDIVWQNSTGKVALWLMNGKTCASHFALNGPRADSGWFIRGTGDFNGDGQTDLLWQNNRGIVSVWLMQSTNYTGHLRVDAPLADKGWTIVGTADLNDDGSMDMLWQHSSGRLVCWFMNSTDFIRSSRLNPFHAEGPWRVVGPK